MKRELNDTEKRVIDAAKTLEKDKWRGTWGATSIQILGWPDSGKAYMAKELGISAAIAELRRRGIVIMHHRHGYRLAVPNVKLTSGAHAAPETEK